MRGTDDGIAEIDDRSISSWERERERDGLCGGQKTRKIKSYWW